jgi:hypothetical protein
MACCNRTSEDEAVATVARAGEDGVPRAAEEGAPVDAMVVEKEESDVARSAAAKSEDMADSGSQMAKDAMSERELFSHAHLLLGELQHI